MMATDLGAFDPAESFIAGSKANDLKLKTEIEIFSQS